MHTRLASYLRRSLVLGAVAAVSAISAAAQNITYTFSGTGSGTVGASSFANAGFSFTVTVATSSVTTAHFGLGTPAVRPVVMSFTIGLPNQAPIATGTFSDAYVFNNQGNSTVGFGTTQRNDLIGLVGVGGASTYDMMTAFGPASGTNLYINQFVNQATSAGDLTVSSVSNVTFEASLAPTDVVPEPSTYALLGTGLFAIAGIARRRRVTA